MSTRPSAIASRNAVVNTPTPISTTGACRTVPFGADDDELGRLAARDQGIANGAGLRGSQQAAAGADPDFRVISNGQSSLWLVEFG